MTSSDAAGISAFRDTLKDKAIYVRGEEWFCMAHADLPGIRWKLHNLGQLAKVSHEKFMTQAEALERLLGN